MKKMIFVLQFFILVLNSTALCNNLNYMEHYLNPKFLSEDTFLVQSIIDDSHYGVFAPQLLLFKKNIESHFTCELPDNPEENLKIDNNRLLITNDQGTFEYEPGAKTIIKCGPPEETKQYAKLDWIDKNSFRFGKEIWGIDEFGLYKNKNEHKEHLFLNNAYQYDISPDKKFFLLLIESNIDSRKMLLVFDIQRKSYLSIETGDIGQPEFAENNTVTYLKHNKIVIFDLATKSKTETGITAEQVQYNPSTNTMFYLVNNTLFRYDMLSRKTTKILSDRIKHFEVEKNNNYILYDNGAELSIYYFYDNSLLGNPVVIAGQFDAYRCFENYILLLRTEYRDYKPYKLPPINNGSELVFLEKLDLNGHPEAIVLLNADFEIYSHVRVEQYKNSFDLLDNQILFTCENLKISSCKVSKIDFKFIP